MRTLLGFGVVAASVGVGLLRARRRAHLRPVGADAANENVSDVEAVAKHSGIADVDPQPLSHVAGEGIDLDNDIAAQQKVKDQREKLPT